MAPVSYDVCDNVHRKNECSNHVCNSAKYDGEFTSRHPCDKLWWQVPVDKIVYVDKVVVKEVPVEVEKKVAPN